MRWRRLCVASAVLCGGLVCSVRGVGLRAVASGLALASLSVASALRASAVRFPSAVRAVAWACGCGGSALPVLLRALRVS